MTRSWPGHGEGSSVASAAAAASTTTTKVAANPTFDGQDDSLGSLRANHAHVNARRAALQRRVGIASIESLETCLVALHVSNFKAWLSMPVSTVNGHLR